MQFYLVRRKSDNLYSSGTTRPEWGTTGRVWTSLQGIKNHLTWFLMGEIYGRDEDGYPDTAPLERRRNPEEYEIVVYEAAPTIIMPVRR